MASCLSYSLLPWPTDDLLTATSHEQEKTESLIRQLLALYVPQPGSSKPPALDVSTLKLEKTKHIHWLLTLLNPLPTPYTSLDASRPWILYWVTHSLALMNAELDYSLKQRAVDTIKSFWNAEEGAFGGGPGQMAHLAPTYASVSALCYLGDSGHDWDWIDRQAIHDWLVTLKQPDGSFVMHRGGEVDVRGCYCALTTAVLLNILTPELARGTSDFIASCQTYEGGLASASHYYPDSMPIAPPIGEAHGGYTFCALASYFALNSTPAVRAAVDPPTSSSRPARELNVKSLLRWSAQMQGLPIEAGGFRGRTNKLVDGCYSWWCGGLFTIIDAMLPSSTSNGKPPLGRASSGDTGSSGSEDWEDEVSTTNDTFNRRALQEYVLIAAQAERGGLRDKPGKGSDAYHSCYNLSGMAAAQQSFVFSNPTSIAWDSPFTPLVNVKGAKETDEHAEARQRAIFTNALAWSEIESKKLVVGDAKSNELMVNHPVYNIVIDKMEAMMRWSYGQDPKVGLQEL